MIRVAVVDDEPLARAGVRARLARHADVVLAGDYADGESALAGLRATPADLAIVDVQMPRMDGLALLAALPPPQRPLAVLLTAHEAFAVQAFALQAVDYLLKPVDDERFDEALDRARQQLALRRLVAAPGAAQAAPRLNRFEVRTGRRVLFVEAHDVAWIEADGDYATLHANGHRHLVRMPLSTLSTRLDPARFVRVHRSAIVRIDQVAELQPLPNRDALLRLADGTPLRVSRSYADVLRACLKV